MAARIDQNGLAVPGVLPWISKSAETGAMRSHSPTVDTAADYHVVPVVRWAFYFFVATIPFEAADFGLPVEITTISLGLLLFSLLFQIPLCLRRPPLAFGLFLLYLILVGIPYFFMDETYAHDMEWQWMIQAQLVLMCWIAYNVARSEQVFRRSLLVLGLSCMLVAILQLTGLSNHFGGYEGLTQRVAAFGFHPNNIARILSLGLLSLIGLAYGFRRSFIQPRHVVWIGFVIIGAAIVQTGSRGGLLALGAGIFVFALRTGDISVKVRNAFLVLAGFGVLLLVVAQFEYTMSRFESALEEGELARRDQIYAIAWDMFLERPVFGWGLPTSQFELGARLAHPEEVRKNAHNLVLHMLIVGGILGSAPFFLGMLLALLSSWRARQGVRGILPLSLITTVLIANMSGNWSSNKMHWLVTGFALASGAAIAAVRRDRTQSKPEAARRRFALE